MGNLRILSALLVVAIVGNRSPVSAGPAQLEIYRGGHVYLGSFYKASTSRSGHSTRQEKTDYFLSTGKASWVNGRDYCQTHINGTLVAIESEEENDILRDVLRGKDVVEAWTSGGYYRDQIFRWYSTNTNFGYVIWDTNEPTNQDPDWRVVIRSRGFFAPWGVARATTDDAKHFICETVIDYTKPVPCPSTHHLALVLDASGSIGSASFVIAKDFVALLASAFKPPSKITLIVYSTTARVDIPITNTMTSAQIDAAIKNAIYSGGNTYTNLGIDAAVAQLDNSPSSIPHKMVVFTDGESNSQALTKISADAALAKGITTFSVGIASYRMPELLIIAGGNPDHVFTTQNFDSLIELIRPLSIKVCEAQE